ncbi:MAG: cell wall hydrolase [Novosphingobium sp.]|nr:cell wall hydrolase [Novosphingobium sp.]MCP5402338.1 cell wall hydrolase [Novosphingobium sp.]
MTAKFTLQPEPRPRDFSARIRRSRTHGISAAGRRKLGGRQALVLMGAVTLPAFAAPQDWQRFEIGNAGQSEVVIEPMPFEKPGNSFPGSAFYYLSSDEEPLPPLAQGIHSDAEDAPSARTASPVARSMFVDNSGVDRNRALQCLTAAIYYEAASEPDSGQRAVAQVVLNRVAHPAYPNTVCGVVYQGSERRTGCQFSFTCDGSLARKPHRMFWSRAENVARAALGGYVHAPAGLATHYHTIQIHPYWADKLSYLGTIGAHRFYSFSGPAGRPGTFRFAYAGGEPAAAPNPRAASPAVAEAQTDPVVLQRSFEQTQPIAASATPATHSPARPPVYTPELEKRGGDSLYRGDKLPKATGIRPEYENSGRWIADPGA